MKGFFDLLTLGDDMRILIINLGDSLLAIIQALMNLGQDVRDERMLTLKKLPSPEFFLENPPVITKSDLWYREQKPSFKKTNLPYREQSKRTMPRRRSPKGGLAVLRNEARMSQPNRKSRRNGTR